MATSFNDTSTKKGGLIQFCERTLFGDDNYGKISDNSTLLASFTNRLNDSLDQVASAIMQFDGRWQWDDNNNTDLPIATSNLVTTLGLEQQDYSFDLNHLRVLRVEIKDANGSWRLLQPIDQRDIYNQSLTDFLKTAGLPLYYDKMGSSIFLYPKPLATAVTSVGGLKVFFQRAPSYFISSDTTKEPGINSLYHSLVGLISCREYALDRGLASAKSLVDRVARGFADLEDDYSLRSRDEKISIAPRPRNFR